MCDAGFVLMNLPFREHFRVGRPVRQRGCVLHGVYRPLGQTERAVCLGVEQQVGLLPDEVIAARLHHVNMCLQVQRQHV